MSVSAKWEILSIRKSDLGIDCRCKSLATYDTTIFSVSNHTEKGKEFIAKATIGGVIEATLKIVQ